MWGSFFAVFGLFHFSALCPFLVAQKLLESENQFLYQAYLSAGSPSVEVETTLIANFFCFLFLICLRNQEQIEPMRICLCFFSSRVYVVFLS